MATATPKVKIGENVIYVSTKGYQKAAFVLNTQETVVEGKSLPELAENQLHLAVLSVMSGMTPRFSVPFQGDVDADATGGYWKKA